MGRREEGGGGKSEVAGRKASSFHEIEILEAGPVVTKLLEVRNVVRKPWPRSLPHPELLSVHESQVGLVGRAHR